MKNKARKGILLCISILVLLICSTIGAFFTLTVSASADVTQTELFPFSITGYESGNVISDGSIVAERVKFSIVDENYKLLYFKTPRSESFIHTKSGLYISGNTSGWYYVYATTEEGEKSLESHIFYDSVKPVGTIYSNGAVAGNGTYISTSFSYSAIDEDSGISAMYYKTPVSGEYTLYNSGTVIPANSGDGSYSFYAVDIAGNQSDILTVYLETQAPLVNIFRNGILAFSKAITKAGDYDSDVYFCPDDILKITCDTSSGNVTSNYQLDTNIIIDNEYSDAEHTITLTSATGVTSNFTFHIVRNKPTVIIGGTSYSDGNTVYFNTDKVANFACDSIIKNFGETGVTINSEGNLNLNEHISYASGKDITLSTADGTETKYKLNLNDRAGNESTITVVIDKCAATGEWHSDEATLLNGGYTNKPLSFVFTEEGVTATYSFNGSEYEPYESGQLFTADGTYVIVLIDYANNKSNFKAHIKTVLPTGQLYANYLPVNSGTYTTESIYFSWDGDITATVNGKPYVKNSVLSEDAKYEFLLIDYAGNTSDYLITIDTVAPIYNMDKLNNSELLISKWYVTSVDGDDYSFAGYDEALSFACDNEFKNNVTVLVLDDIADFKQYHLVANNDKVRTGEYWLYKSKANPDSFLYYFERTSLNDVINYYAKEKVSVANYFELGGKNLYGNTSYSMSDNIFTAPNGTKVPVLNRFIFDKVDSAQLFAELVGGDGTRTEIEYCLAFDTQITVGGLYKIIELDEAKNERTFFGYLDLFAPKLKISATIMGEETPVEFTVSQDKLTNVAAYYYDQFIVNEIVDADKWAVLEIEHGGNIDHYTYGDILPCIQVDGEYLLKVYDRLGNSYSFTVFIIGKPASITFANNEDDTAFSLAVTLEQKFDTIVSLEIRRNGELIEGVSKNELFYSFDRSGKYTVTLRDNFGRVIEREYVFNKALPTGTLEGVTNGGKTKTEVTFDYDSSKFYVVVFKDGQVIETESNGKLVFEASDVNSGNYNIRLIRISDPENFTEYSFVINTLAPEFDLSVDNGATTNKNVTVTWAAKDIVSATYSLNGGEAVEILSNTIFTADGIYTVTTTNDLGTQSIKTFTIDKTLDYVILLSDGNALDTLTTNKDVMIINNEPLYINVSKNGEQVEFDFGQVLFEEGIYSLYIFDDYNNATSFSVIIDKSVEVYVSTGNGVITNETVIITAGEKVNYIATKDGVNYSYELGDEISDEGKYKVTVCDSVNNDRTITFQIVKGIKTKLDYTLGENVKIKSIMRDGEAVSVTENRLNFIVDGTYYIVCESEGKEYAFMLSLDTTAPTIRLNGISNGGKGNVTVTITDLSEEGIIEVYKDGEKIEYKLGSELKEYGKYLVKVRDELGNEREYNFVLKYKMNGGAIALIIIGILFAIGIVVAIIFGKKAVYKYKFKNAPKLTDEELAEEVYAQTDINTDEDSSAE